MWCIYFNPFSPALNINMNIFVDYRRRSAVSEKPLFFFWGEKSHSIWWGIYRGLVHSRDAAEHHLHAVLWHDVSISLLPAVSPAPLPSVFFFAAACHTARAAWHFAASNPPVGCTHANALIQENLSVNEGFFPPPPPLSLAQFIRSKTHVRRTRVA